MNPRVRLILTVSISLGLLALFVILYGQIMVQTWKAEKAGGHDTPPKQQAEDKKPDAEEAAKNPLTYIPAALSGLIGAVVAVGFGQKPPDDNRRGKLSFTERLARQRDALGYVLVGDDDQERWKQIVGTAYVVVYLLYGVAALLLWWWAKNPPDQIANLAATFFGLALAVARAFLLPAGGLGVRVGS